VIVLPETRDLAEVRERVLLNTAIGLSLNNEIHNLTSFRARL
jgi:hypothetical protein